VTLIIEYQEAETRQYATGPSGVVLRLSWWRIFSSPCFSYAASVKRQPVRRRPSGNRLLPARPGNLRPGYRCSICPGQLGGLWEWSQGRVPRRSSNRRWSHPSFYRRTVALHSLMDFCWASNISCLLLSVFVKVFLPGEILLTDGVGWMPA